MKTVPLLCLLLLAGTLAGAQEVRFRFNKQNILLGEPIEMTVEALGGAGTTGEFFSLDTLPHFEVLDQSRVDTALDGGVMRLKQTVVITSWDSGTWRLPSLIRNGQALQPVNIEVRYTSPWNPQQPYHDIKGIAPVKNPGRSTWWWYLIGLAVLVALFLLFFPQEKKKEGTVELDSNAYRKAMQALEQLQKKGVEGDAKTYYTELINIFRGYLKGAKGIQSFSKTTDDLGLQLQGQPLPPPAYNSLLQTLRLSDLVKFAQYRPEPRLSADALQTIKQSITTIEQGHAV